MRIYLSAAFAVAITALAGAAVAYAQSVSQAEEELLGGPDAPITLRPPARVQPAPPVIAQKPSPPAKPVVAQEPPVSPKVIVAKKPSTSRAKPVVARKPPPISPKIVVAEKPRLTKPAAAPRVAAPKPAPPAAEAKPAPKISVAQPIPRAPPLIARNEPPQAASAAPPLPEPPIVLAERDDAPIADEETVSPRDEIAPVPDQQFAQLDRMIERAVRRGDIRPRTANLLYDDLVDIADMQEDLLNDGALRADDRDQINARLDELRERIDGASQTESGWR